MIRKLSCLFLILSLDAYEICYDLNMSPYAGGSDLLFSTRCIECGSSYISEKIGTAHSRSLAAKFFRFGELTALYLPLNYFASIVQHEVFGHGYRIRDINHGKIHVTGYDFSFPPPYGPGNGATFFTLNPDTITTTDLTCVSMAGLEAQSILAEQTAYKWLEDGFIDPKQTVLYLVSRFAINLYGSSDENNVDGHDLSSYVESLNLTYTESQLAIKELRNLSWINLADPLTYCAAYAWGYYIFSGKETKIPMIPLLGCEYLFGARLGLTPFGPEYFLDNYLVQRKKPIYFYVKGGMHAKNTYLGLGFFAPRIWTKHRWFFGARWDCWKQPQLLLKPGDQPLSEIDFRDPPDPNHPLYSCPTQHRSSYGCAASFICGYQKNKAMGLGIELGFKTMGFLPGYSLKSSPVIRISYLASF